MILFLIFINGKTGTVSFLEWIRIEDFKFFANCLVEFFKWEKFTISKMTDNSVSNIAYAPFNSCFILWHSDSGRNNCNTIVFCHFLIWFIENRIFILFMGYNTCLQIVWNQQAWHTIKIFEHVNVTVNPVFRFHRKASLNIAVHAERQCSYK